ncbi:MAG: TSUP family transporter [Microthrixaceae bacterium]
MTVDQLLLIAVASLAGAMVKSVVGMGYPVLAVPLIALGLGVEDAVVVVALPNLAANAYLWWESRDATATAGPMGRFLVFGSLGAVLGTVALVRLAPEPLMIVLALSVVVFVVNFLARPDFELAPALARRLSPLVGMVAGLLQGAIGVSGPVVAGWVHTYKLPPRAFVHSITAVFGLTGAIQVIVLALQGQFTSARFAGIAVAAVPVAAVMPVGVRLRNRLAGSTFDRVVLAALSVSAVSLLADALGVLG